MRMNKQPAAGRRGQTLVVALAVLFLLVLLGGIFVTMVVRNLQRTTRQTRTDTSLSLAMAGLQYASQQFRSSEEGSDWRPSPSEPLWRNPQPPPNISAPLAYPDPQRIYDLNGSGALEADELRRLDPDAQWLDPATTNGRPFVRIATGRGRFLLRVTYLPQWRFAGAASEANGVRDEFDSASQLIHVEAIGRPGEIDTNDPSFFAQDATVEGVTKPVGPLRKVDAFVPVGLVDQLWWITNLTGERGPADMGVPAFEDGHRVPIEYPSLFNGTLRSNVDVRWHGRTLFRVYPARGEGVFIRGKVVFAVRGNAPQQGQPGFQPTNLSVLTLDDNGSPSLVPQPPGGPPVIPPDNQDDNPANDAPLSPINPTFPNPAPEGESNTAQFNSVRMLNAGRELKHAVLDELFERGTAAAGLTPERAQSIRMLRAPRLDQKNSATGVSRWLSLTRDSGATITITDAGQQKLINTGWYALTNPSGNPQMQAFRARGLYLDNFGDIQYPGDRNAVKDEWLQRGNSDSRRRGWLGDHYIPTVVENGVAHPVAEMLLTRAPRDPNLAVSSTNPVVPKMRITRFDTDQRQLNLAPETGRQRKFYALSSINPANKTGTLTPIGQTQDFEYPENGVVYFEGSVRVRGMVGVNYDPANGAIAEQATRPRSLSIVSGGSIYIEGNLTRVRGWNLALLAHDFVTLNPTMFTRIDPGDDVVVEADTFGENGQPTGYHFNIPQGSDLDFTIASANALNLANSYMHVRHSAVQESARSETSVVLNLPFLGPAPTPWPDWNRDRYDFGQNPPSTPPPPPSPGYITGQQRYYLFTPLPAIPPAAPWPWATTNIQTVPGQPANFERKSFVLGGAATLPAGFEGRFRMQVGPKDGPNGPEMSGDGQPYWLSRVAIMPRDQPLRIRVEAVMYAYHGSWFVIPPPFFNDNPVDDYQNYTSSGLRAQGTQPVNTADHPFHNEPLNVEIEIVGAITENMPAETADKAAWTRALWQDPDRYQVPPVNSAPARTGYQPNIIYRFDHDLRRMVRARVVRTGEEFIAYVAPLPAGGSLPPGVVDLQALRSTMAAGPVNSYVETLPLLPRLPSSDVIYEGRPL